MSANALLKVLAGPSALATIRDEGLRPERIEVVPGASGGPKWMVLNGLDRVLFGEFLRPRERPVHLIGSSIGSWRFACIAQSDPIAALDRFEQAYLAQSYPPKPSPALVSERSGQVLDALLGSDGARDVISNRWLRTHIVTACCQGLSALEHSAAQMLAFGVCALGNLFSRRALGLGMQRVIFHSAGDASPFAALSDLPTRQAALTEHNLRPALMASGSIPMVLQGVRDIPGGGAGTYRDGGIIDYHFDIPFPDHGLVLYPHFYPYLVPGWFDKALRWRRAGAENLSRTVIVAPSPEFIARLPYGKIPDRRDFVKLGDAERRRYWSKVLEASRDLGDAFAEMLASGSIRRYAEAL